MFFNQRQQTLQKPIQHIYQSIQEFNLSHSEDRIKFLHAGSSAVFAFIGRETTVYDKDNHVSKKLIPKALIPTGLLRRQYGVYPVSGELEIGVFNYGCRKAGINYRFISGMEPTLQGAETVYDYARHSCRKVDISEIFERIDSLIKHMSENLYQRSLKILLMEITNLRLLYPDDTHGEQFLTQLMDKREQLLKAVNLEKKQSLLYLFDKYTGLIEELINGTRLPIETDEAFQDAIFNQYPMIFCSTATPRDFSDGVPGEQIIEGELNLDTVKLIFAPNEYVNDARRKLENNGLQSIKVLGFNPHPHAVNGLYAMSTDTSVAYGHLSKGV